ncbi:metalloregulator ArsR/SmtB family transcription factor [Arenimonas sp.]|uniref:metalloregulator ArsR/SmtB family transcription factor n=1 Tax=Arenimonas sp. TaxID=1872635 RepID=UPI0035B361D4
MDTVFPPSVVFKCLADETRARLAVLLARSGELCVCELTASLGESQPKISRHLATLRSAGLLSDRRDGSWVHYRINSAAPAWVFKVLESTYAGNVPWMAEAERRLPPPGQRRSELNCGARQMEHGR